MLLLLKGIGGSNPLCLRSINSFSVVDYTSGGCLFFGIPQHAHNVSELSLCSSYKSI